MAQNQPMKEAVKHINTAFQHLTLALDKIDKAQTNGTPDDVPVLREFRVKQNAIRGIGNPYLIPLTADQRNYEALRETLEINDQRNDFQLLTAEEYKSPRDLVSVLVANNDATKATVKKLFEKQYEFKWHTGTGDPDQFSFYGFCEDVKDVEGEDVMMYDTRKAHVISRLYHAQKELQKIRHLPYKKLCPPVYVRTRSFGGIRWRWTKWIFNCENNEFITNTHINTNINSWILKDNQLITHLEHNSVLTSATGQLPNEVGHLYWAVLKEDDYDNDREPTEILPFRTQVYVGIAKNGIKERWTGGGTSHCKKMEFARDVMCDMLSYDPTALRSEQLVDLRLLLHKACNQDDETSGLFIMEQFTKEDDTEQIIGDKSRLVPAEGKNINGKKTSSDEFILNVRQNENWIPKDMNYGMNKRA
jgi:hypothetical protein